MGYDTDYTLGARRGGEHLDIPEGLDLFKSWVTQTFGEVEVRSFEWFCDDYLHEQEKRWYDWEKDMRALALLFPGVCFELHGVGSEQDDIWTAYFEGEKYELHTQTVWSAPPPSWGDQHCGSCTVEEDMDNSGHCSLCRSGAWADFDTEDAIPELTAGGLPEDVAAGAANWVDDLAEWQRIYGDGKQRSPQDCIAELLAAYKDIASEYAPDGESVDGAVDSIHDAYVDLLKLHMGDASTSKDWEPGQESTRLAALCAHMHWQIHLVRCALAQRAALVEQCQAGASAIRAIAANWETGDLAGAVNAAEEVAAQMEAALTLEVPGLKQEGSDDSAS